MLLLQRDNVLASTALLLLSYLLSCGQAMAQAAPRHPPVVEVNVQTLLSGLNHPWSLVFLPNSQGALITERSGELRLWHRGKPLSAPIAGVPKVWANGQAGLWDLCLAPDFVNSRRLYLSFAQQNSQGHSYRVLGYATLAPDNLRLTNFKTIFRSSPLVNSLNLGGRILFDQAGNILMSIGDNNQRSEAQQLNSLNGKIIRLTLEGGIPQDNPFVNKSNARSEIWSYGHRDPQGLAFNPWNGELWQTEHSPHGFDEINIIKAGKNYGRPLVTYSIGYLGQSLSEAKGTRLVGVERPLYHWKISPVVSSMAFYTADRFPQWKHTLFVAALQQKAIIELKLDGQQVSRERRLLVNLGKRIHKLQVGPDGYLYALTDEKNGRLLQISPK